jgi:ribonuclease HII
VVKPNRGLVRTGPPSARRTAENALRRLGFSRVAGVDEVGRGCLAGPVVAAAVVLPPADRLRGLRDSKLLTGAARARLFDEIVGVCEVWSIGFREPEEIDRINIQEASLAAMRDAVAGLTPLPDFVLVDAFRIPGISVPQRGVVGGDRLCACIAAASILAKVTRDRLMTRLHDADPRYGFHRHKGYATPEHLAAMAQHGYSTAHRRSFRPKLLLDAIG